MHITVLGAGAFGTAIAQLLATNGHAVTLWCYEQEVADAITRTRINARYLPATPLHSNITATTSLQEACTNSLIFVAIPVKHLRAVLVQTSAYITTQHTCIMLSKGIESNTLLLPSQIVQDIFPHISSTAIAVLSGPSYAQEVAAEQPTSIMLAAADKNFAHEIESLVSNNWFNAKFTDDIAGVQLCAAYKNVAALAVGMLAGAGYGENTKALMLMHCLAEMRTLLSFFGAQEQTVYSSAGLGDLMLTCYGKLSRNQAAGMLLGQGKKLSAIITQLGTEPEGINSVVAFHELTKKNNLTLPICSTAHEIIFNSKSVADLLAAIKY